MGLTLNSIKSIQTSRFYYVVGMNLFFNAKHENMNTANKQYIEYFELNFMLSKNFRIATLFYQQQSEKVVAKFKFKIVKD